MRAGSGGRPRLGGLTLAQVTGPLWLLISNVGFAIEATSQSDWEDDVC